MAAETAQQSTPVFREVASGLQFPEGQFVVPGGDIGLCEVAAGTLVRISDKGKKTLIATLGGSPGGAAIGPDGKVYVCNGGSAEFKRVDGKVFPHIDSDTKTGWVERVDLDTGRVERLYTECDGQPLNAPNDIAFDRSGGFWFTDHGKVRQNDRDHGALYYARTDGSMIRRAVSRLFGPNGVALSPGGDRLYLAETPTARLWAFDLGSPGEIVKSPEAQLGGKGHLIAGLGGYQWLDSLAVDSAGNICVATIFKGGLVVLSPDGADVQHLPMPDVFTTNICFGGDGLRTAYITLSSTGRLVAMAWPHPGLPLAY